MEETTYPPTLLKITNLLGAPVLMHVMIKSEPVLGKASVILIRENEWEILRVHPGMDIDKYQTLLAFTRLSHINGDIEVPPEAHYDIFEVGRTGENHLFWRSTDVSFDCKLERLETPRQSSLAIQGVRAVQADMLCNLLISSLIPTRLENHVELVFVQDGAETSSSSSFQTDSDA